MDDGWRMWSYVEGIHQYMNTWNGPADFLEEPVSPITGTKFENAKSTKVFISASLLLI